MTWKPCLFNFGTGDKADRWVGETDGTTWNGFDNVRVRPEVHAAIVARFGTDEDGVHQIPEKDGWHDYSNGFVTKVEQPLFGDYDELVDAIIHSLRHRATVQWLLEFAADIIAVLNGAQFIGVPRSVSAAINDDATVDDGPWGMKDDQIATVEDAENVRQILDNVLTEEVLSALPLYRRRL